MQKQEVLTFLQRLADFDVAVRALELVEEGSYFELVGGAFAELSDHGRVLGRTPDLKHGPVAPRLPRLG